MGIASLAVVVGCVVAATPPERAGSVAVPPVAPANGPRWAEPTLHALVGGTVHTGPGESIQNGVVLLEGGRVAAVGEASKVQVPAEARVWEVAGHHLYAGFIDPYVEVEAARGSPTEAGAHWSPNVTPLRRASVDGETARALRRLGFAVAGVAPMDAGLRRGGVFRGWGSVVSLGEEPSSASRPRPGVYRAEAYQSVAFETSGGDAEDVDRWASYPSSKMGAIALVRQTLADTDEAKRRGRVPAGLEPLVGGMLVFKVSSELDVSRAAGVGGEFGRAFAVVGTGTEYRRVGSVARAMASEHARGLVVPVNFPKAPDVSTVGRAEDTDLRTLMSWEQAPTNPRRLEESGVRASLTTSRLRDRADFWGNVRKAIRHGLSKEAALAMVTVRPASLLGVSGEVGEITPGRVANVVVADGDLFDPEGSAKVMTLFVEGHRYEVRESAVDLAGVWEITIPGAKPADRVLVLEGSEKRTRAYVRRDGKEAAAELRVSGRQVSWTFDHEPLDGTKGVFTMTGSVLSGGTSMSGTGLRADGGSFGFTAVKREPSKALGEWRVVKVDGVAKADDGEGVTLEIKPRQVRVEFAKPGAARVVIESGDVVFTPTGLKFSHSMEKLGGDGRSRDECVVEGDVLRGKGVLEDGSEHTYEAVRVEKQRRTPKVDPALVGRWLAERPERGAGEGHGVVAVYVTKAGGVVLHEAGRVIELEKVAFKGTTFRGEMGGGVEGGARVNGVIAEGSLRVEVARAGDDSAVLRAVRVAGDPEVLARVPEVLPMPFNAYGRFGEVALESVAIRNATVWTSGPRGIIENGVVVVREGTIAFVGTSEEYAAWGGAKAGLAELDAKGKHLTPGLIDCHSHTSLGTANESGQAVTAEVRIADEVNPDDVNWYRQLAGGLTMVNSLHGSANSIGGQNAVLKLRWGTEDASGMLVTEAAPGIKFALGENPKRGNSGSRSTGRYPQTRMGVEAQIRERLQAAREYAATPAGERGRDLELEILAEVLSGKRLVHCHAYRQDEIVMLCEVARDFGFRIGTFQHVLEGYKVAEYVREYSGGGSAFSDWWAFKVEVQDGIPQGPPLMHKVGAVVSYNSDDTELARRMQGEAAKGVKYGGLAAGEALTFVTINPAKQLKVDAVTGSIEAGKRADLALWSGSPISTASRCEATWVEGRRLFDIAEDRVLRQRDAGERKRLLQKALGASGERAEEGGGDTEEEVRRPRGMSVATYVRMVQLGIDPWASRAGECGCGEVHE